MAWIDDFEDDWCRSYTESRERGAARHAPIQYAHVWDGALCGERRDTAAERERRGQSRGTARECQRDSRGWRIFQLANLWPVVCACHLLESENFRYKSSRSLARKGDVCSSWRRFKCAVVRALDRRACGPAWPCSQIKEQARTAGRLLAHPRRLISARGQEDQTLCTKLLHRRGAIAPPTLSIHSAALKMPLPSEDTMLLAPEAARLMQYSQNEYLDAVSIVEARHAAAAAAAAAELEADRAQRFGAKRQAAKEMEATYCHSMPQIAEYKPGSRGAVRGGGQLPSRASSAATVRLAESRSASHPVLPGTHPGGVHLSGTYQPGGHPGGHPGASQPVSRPSTAVSSVMIDPASQQITPAASAMPSRPSTGKLIRNLPHRPGSATRLPSMIDAPDAPDAPDASASSTHQAHGVPKPPPPHGAPGMHALNSAERTASAAREEAHSDLAVRDRQEVVMLLESMQGELRGVRRQNGELDAELRSTKAIAAQYRSRLQAFSDSLRSSGLTVPSDADTAFYTEATSLLQTAVDLQYGGRVGRQQLSPSELRAVRLRYEQRVQQASALKEHSEAESATLRQQLTRAHAQLEAMTAELSRLRESARHERLMGEERASVEAKEATTRAAKVDPKASDATQTLAAAPAEPQMRLSEHEAKMKELQLQHAKEVDKAVEKARAEADNKGRAMLSQTATASAQQVAEMQRQLMEHEAAAAERARLEEERARAERVDLFQRQFARRMQNVDLTRGWTAWLARWEAKTYALARLQQAGNRLRAPALASLFDHWAAFAVEARHEAEHRAALKANETLEGQLRLTQYELSQQTMIRMAHEDELKGLHEKVATLESEAMRNAELVARASATSNELVDIKEMYREAMEEAEEAKERATAVADDARSQREGNEALLRKLLDEQRAVFDSEMAVVREQLAAKTEAQKREARIDALRKSAMRRIKYREVHLAWDRWAEMWTARNEAKARLRRLSGHAPLRGAMGAFTRWTDLWRAQTRFLREMSAEQQLAHAQRLQEELDRVQSDLSRAAEERDALRAKVIELSGGAEAMEEDTRRMLMEHEAKERERRIDLLGRQAGRRLLHEGVRRGFEAWRELFEARRYAMGMLHRTANRIRNREVWDALCTWIEFVQARWEKAELDELREAPGRWAGCSHGAVSLALKLTPWGNYYPYFPSLPPFVYPLSRTHAVGQLLSLLPPLPPFVYPLCAAVPCLRVCVQACTGVRRASGALPGGESGALQQVAGGGARESGGTRAAAH